MGVGGREREEEVGVGEGLREKGYRESGRGAADGKSVDEIEGGVEGEEEGVRA